MPTALPTTIKRGALLSDSSEPLQERDVFIVEILVDEAEDPQSILEDVLEAAKARDNDYLRGFTIWATA